MMCLRSCFRLLFPISNFFANARTLTAKARVAVILLAAATCFAQDQPPTAQQAANSGPADAASTITIPSGTRLALVLTQPIQTRYVRRGDDIYAQITFPVNSGNDVVNPPGTFVQGTIDKVGRNGGRGELRLQSMSITFPDGYVTPIAGPLTLESSDGYAIKDPGSKRFAGAIALPVAGQGIGALVGHSVGSSQSTLTNSLPPGCVGPPPACLSSSLPFPGSSGKDAAIGASIGGAVGAIGSVILLFSSHHFYLDAGTPVQATLQQPVTLQRDEVAKAVRQSEEHPVAEQAITPRPVAPPTVIPGAPGPDGIPGPPTIIPGTPPTPGTPYPCP